MSKERYFVIYDGDCGFCQSTVDLVKKLDWLSKFNFIPFQSEDVFKKFNKLNKEKCEKEIYLVKEVNGEQNYYGGYDAFKIMAVYLPVTFLISWFFFLPPVVQIGRIVYRLIAENRHKIKVGNKFCKPK